MRITIFSPNAVGIVEIRSSTSLPSGVTVLMRPSCGRRFSTISIRASSLIRDVIAMSTGVGNRVDLLQHAVDAEAHQTDVAARLDVDVGRALLERVLPQPVDDVDDVAVVGVEIAALAQFDQLLEIARERQLTGRDLLRLLHRPGEVVELAEVAPDVLRIGEDLLDLELQHLRQLVGPGADEGLAGGDRERGARHLHRQDPVALGVGVRHRLRHAGEVDLQRIDVQVRYAELSGEPLDEPVERERRMRRPAPISISAWR